MFGTHFDENEKLWSSDQSPSIFNPNASLGQLILYALKAHATRVAQINDDTGIVQRYDEILSKSIRAAQNLRSRGYGKGQIFGFVATNTHNVAPIIFASLYLGCPVNPLDSSFGKNEMKHMLSNTKPCLIFCDTSVYGVVKESLNEHGNSAEIITFGGQIGDSKPVEELFVENGDENTFLPTTVDAENDIAFIICSSGTTGLSKGVCLSHVMMGDRTVRYAVLNSDDIILCYSSLYWITGLNFLLGGTLIGAKRILTTQSPSLELQFRMIEQYKVTCFFNSPYQSTLFSKSELIKTANLTSVKNYFIGGGRIPQEVPIQINKYLANGSVHIVYGLSEVTCFATADFPGSRGQDTVGQLISGLHVKIVDDDGNRCGVGVNGEICMKGLYRVLGYYNNEAATADLFDSEGFVQTGDIGHFDQDGYLYIVDRKREMLKFRGYQVAPSYIEGHLMKSPLIKSVGVVGIPDDTDGDLIAALIVRNGPIDEEAVHNMIDEKFADYCKLRGGVYFADSLPTTPSGKLLRRKIKEYLIEINSKKIQQ